MMSAQRRARDFARGLVAIAAVLLFSIGVLAQEPVKIYGLTIPERIGGLTHGPVLDFETKARGLGYSLQFSRPGWTVDVYIYDFQLKAIPADLNSAVMQNHIARAKGDIFGLQQRGLYHNVDETDDFKVGDAGKTQFACSTFSYSRAEKKDQNVESYLCLTSWNNKFVKVRMTAVKGDISRADAMNFVEAWVSLLSTPT